mmetsp:Transcript_24270/g.50452  ORF Transcript_24270/g.50452 Transcript_24270/m.50452 type:complete len:243 (-) Transcript_24270:478-1206(-)
MRLFFVLGIIGTQIFFAGQGQSGQATSLFTIGRALGSILTQKDGFLPQYDITGHARSRRRNNGTQGIPPKDIPTHGGRLTRQGIQQMNDFGNVLDQDQSSNVAQITSRFGRQVQQIIFTQGTNFGQIGEFVIGNVGFDIGTNQFFGRFEFDGYDTFQKANEPCGLALVGEIKIHTIAKGFNAQTTTMRPVFQNQLFQIQKGSFVGDALSDLHHRLPRALSKFCRTFQTLLIANGKIGRKGLL